MCAFTLKRFAPLFGLFVLWASATWGAEPALGDRNFYPTSERPIGYRGDGNGFFPGAHVPTEWWEGTPTDSIDHPDYADHVSKNIVWKTELPSWGNCPPLVVGDKVFTFGEPDLLICVDAVSGRILWSKSINAWACAGVDAKVAAQVRELYDIWLACDSIAGFLTVRGTVGGAKPHELEREVSRNFLEVVLPRVATALKSIDPEGDYAQAEQTLAAGLTKRIELKECGEELEKHPHKALNESAYALNGAIRRRIEALAGKKLRLGRAWSNLCGTMACPASDGELLYVSMGQGQVAAVAFDGTIRWSITPFKKIPVEDTEIPHGSPLLIGNVLYTTCGEQAVGLDKATGKMLWSAAIEDKTVAIAKVVRLELAGKPMDVIVTPCCRIFRPSDGKLLGTLPYENQASKEHLGRGASVVNSGPIVFITSCADNYLGPMKAFALKAESADVVTAEKIWGTTAWKSSCPFGGKVATSDRYYCGAIYDSKTGEKLYKFERDVGGLSELLIGNQFYYCLQNYTCNHEEYQAWNERRPDGKALADFGVADADGKLITAHNRLGDASRPRVPYLEKWANELYNDPNFHNGGGGRPAHFFDQDTGMMPQGNRLFIRTIGHLYCIGDPKQPY